MAHHAEAFVGRPVATVDRAQLGFVRASFGGGGSRRRTCLSASFPVPREDTGKFADLELEIGETLPSR